jgi:flavin-dependent dehydrogenase
MPPPRDVSHTSDAAGASAPPLELDDGSRVAVIGGGPAGSFFSYFLLDIAGRFGREVTVDMYEPRDFSGVGPAACNMCGGIISESLVQNLAAEGINIPAKVVQRGIESYTLHMDMGTVRIETPLDEMRIGAVHRATGPRDLKVPRWESFDGFMQNLAVESGANLIRDRVSGVAWRDGRPVLETKSAASEPYDLLVVAAGVNSPTLKLFDESPFEYKPPKTTKTFIREFFVGEERIESFLGNSMHVFLLAIPGLEFAAIIPKGDYASICLLGDDINKSMLESFLGSPEVKDTMPPGWEAALNSCQCSPKMNVGAALRPFGDRVVFVGDAGVTRLYKDGIGAAYRTAKAAASTAVIHGVSRSAFAEHYEPVCRSIESDNSVGRIVFRITEEVQKRGFARRAILRTVAGEQRRPSRRRAMSMVLWDLFTGSATYRDIFKRALRPGLMARFAWDLARSIGTTNERRST